ncbi:hypothetical protein [Nesterenkonia haasae]|uniref:hypothetical protein n=1 Tax=Nesterenkonia haasae TaxID=2587813 RepID=UPI001391C673|nr:hypothetical protein [Nesterenkonia haasae]NDK31254.1 hypothetical protein [Nesterenkonia haasae]
MTHPTHTAITTAPCELSLIHRAALAFSGALVQWVEASSHKQQPNDVSAASVNARRLRLQGAERRREEAVSQSFLMPRQF